MLGVLNLYSMENWKDIKGFEGLYQASDCGRIRSLPRKTIYKDGRIGNHKGRVLLMNQNHKGYLVVYLSRDSKKYSRLVHRLVAQTFIANPCNVGTVNHKDTDKLNNNTWNLEWMTNIDNIRHAFDNGLFKDRDSKKKRNEIGQFI
jgi:hypothetical protein